MYRWKCILTRQVLLRNRLKYALSGREVIAITAQRLIKVDNKIRSDPTFPTGFMDVVSIEKSGEHFRLCLALVPVGTG